MVRASTRIPIADPPAEVKLSSVPNIRMASGAVEWIAANLGITVTERYVRAKSNEGRIRYSIISGMRYYSSAALWEFVASTQKAVVR